jgi:putative ABC transport system permease protein
MRQLAIAFRSLMRQRGFFLGAASAMSLGIAAPTALFALVQGALLKPLPYANPDEIYAVRTAFSDGRFTVGLVASEELASARRSTDLISASALAWRQDVTLNIEGVDARPLVATGVSEGFFDLFGRQPALGRPFAPEEYKETLAMQTVVLSDRLWRSSFGADPAVIGKSIQLSRGPATVVGVAPPGFDVPHDTDLWFPVFFREGMAHLFDGYVRLKPGTTVAALGVTLKPMWDALGQKDPAQAKNRVFVFRPLLESIVGDLGPTAWMAFGATALLLLLAIANATNLLLARAASKSKEFATRVAIGATRTHLLKQLISESFLIAAAATLAGLPLAYGLVRVITTLGGSALPRAEDLRFDPMVAVFAAAAMALAAIVIGALPAWTTADLKVSSALNEAGRGGFAGPRTRRLLSTFVIAEVALAIVLVAGASRLLLSARNLLAVDPGFRSEGRMIVDVLLPAVAYGNDPARTVNWSAEAATRVKQLGAEDFSMMSSIPLRREWDSTTFTDVVGRPQPPQSRSNGRRRIVDPGALEALGIRMARGRAFSPDDRMETQKVLLVNEAWVAKSLPAGVDPLNEQVHGIFARRVGDHFEPEIAPIVGVVADVRYAGLDKSAEPTVYISSNQWNTLRRSYVVTSRDGHPERIISGIRDALRSLDPSVPVQFEMMQAIVTSSMVWSRLGFFLLATFGTIALVLVGTGVFGVLAFAVVQRQGEMALRLCLGATPRDVRTMILGQGARLALIGGALGALVAMWTGQIMARFVFQVEATNLTVLLGSVTLVAIVSVAATLVPARRAATADPTSALRG